MRNSIEEEYFSWLKSKVCDAKQERTYDSLLEALHNVEYVPEFDMDENRTEDGNDLRYRFAYEYNYKGEIVDDISNYCSVLELMIALALRMEEEIMINLEYGDRTGQWFWNMIHSLGLSKMRGKQFNQRKFDKIIDIFMRHKYESDGHGGLFIVNSCEYDMSQEEIWVQMNWYLNELEE